MMAFWGYVAFSMALGVAFLVAASIYREWMRDHHASFRLVWINRNY